MTRPKNEPLEPVAWLTILFVLTVLCSVPLGCQPQSKSGGGSVQTSERHTDSVSYPPPATQAERATYTVDHPAPPAKVETWAVDRTYYPPPAPSILNHSERTASTTQPTFTGSTDKLALGAISADGGLASSSATFQRVEAGARANWMWVIVFAVGAVVLLFLRQWLAAIGCVALGVVATVYPVVFLIGAVLGLAYAGWLVYQRTKDAAEQRAEAQIQRKVVDQTVLGINEAKVGLYPDAWKALKASLASKQDADVQRVVTRAKEKLKGVAK